MMLSTKQWILDAIQLKVNRSEEHTEGMRKIQDRHIDELGIDCERQRAEISRLQERLRATVGKLTNAENRIVELFSHLNRISNSAAAGDMARKAELVDLREFLGVKYTDKLVKEKP